MIIRTGIDLIEIERVAAALSRYGDRFLRRIFTQQEIHDSQNKPESLATRFAAKEAVSKALGCGIGEVGWLDIEILSGINRQPLGCGIGEVGWLDIEILSGINRQPYLVLHRRALQRSQQQNLSTWSISLSHSLHQAAAIVVAIGEQDSA